MSLKRYFSKSRFDTVWALNKELISLIAICDTKLFADVIIFFPDNKSFQQDDSERGKKMISAAECHKLIHSLAV